MLVFRAEIHKILVRTTNREDPDLIWFCTVCLGHFGRQIVFWWKELHPWISKFCPEKIQFCQICILIFCNQMRERSGSVVECLTQDRGAAGSSLTCVTALCPWAWHINPSLILVQRRKTHPYIAERLLIRRKESNQTKAIKWTWVCTIWGAERTWL